MRISPRNPPKNSAKEYAHDPVGGVFHGVLNQDLWLLGARDSLNLTSGGWSRLRGDWKRQNRRPAINSQRTSIGADKCGTLGPQTADCAKPLFQHRAESARARVFDAAELLGEPV